MTPRFDLQAHSTCSDGSLAPAAVVARAAAAGVELLALTDHDTVDGVAEAGAAARAHGIALTPACEISAVDVERELHILGYGVDPVRLAPALEDWRADRGARIGAMADRLRAHGVPLDDAVLRERAAGGLPLGRPHLADAVLSRTPGLTRQEVFARYLVPGAPTFVRRTRPTVAEAVEAIRAAGGVAVWAHPFWDVEEPAQVMATLDRLGIDGVECFYRTHTREQTVLLHTACTERSLLITGSADFHGPGHECFDAFLAFETHGLNANLGSIEVGA